MRHDCKDTDQGRSRSSARLVDSILAERGAARLIELYYWSREPGVLEMIRAIATMSDEARAALEVFLAMSNDPGAIAAHWGGSGQLTLTSPQADQAVAVIRFCAEHDENDKPPLPN
jgi:hypothetical protein